MTSFDYRLARAAPLAVAATVALVTLAACGGGGGGGSTSTMPTDGEPTTTISTRAQALTSSVAAANTAAKIAQAAGAQPAPGSVTQSSNVDSSNITTDQVRITAQHGTGGPSFSVRNGTAWSIGTSDGNPSRIPDTPSPWQGVELSKRIGSNVLYVDAYTDIAAPRTETTGSSAQEVMASDTIVFTDIPADGPDYRAGQTGTLNGETGTFRCSDTCSWDFDIEGTRASATVTINNVQGMLFVPDNQATRTVNDTDYLAGGVWLIFPDDEARAADYEFGAFADGSDPFMQSNLAAVTGAAIYTGGATGVYSLRETEGTTVGYLEADVRLTANFGDANGLGTISGSMTGFVADDTPIAGTLDLGTANIGAQNSGFFRGTVSGADGERGYTGHWGGQFFGNGQADGRPGSVAGTFGGHSTDDAVSFVGAFGAHK